LRQLNPLAQAWIAVVVAGGCIAIAMALGGVVPTPEAFGLESPVAWSLILFAAVAHAFPVIAPRHQAYHATQALLMASVLTLTAPAIVLAVIVAHTIEWLRRRRPLYIQAFNVAVYLISAELALLTVSLGGGLPFKLNDAHAIAAALAGALVFLLCNHFLTAVVLRLARGVSFGESGLFGRESLGIDAALLCIGLPIGDAIREQPLAALVAAAPLVVMYRALRMANVEIASHRDVLTGLYNARHFEEALDIELRRAATRHEPTGIAVLAVDRVAPLVQRHGRASFDFLVAAIAERVQARLPRYDVVARVSDESLGLLLTGDDPATVERTLRALLAAVAEAPFGVPTTRDPVVASVSVAFACTREDIGAADALQQLQRAADRARLTGPRSVVGIDMQRGSSVSTDQPASAPTPNVTPIRAGRPELWSPPRFALPLLELVIVAPALVLSVLVLAQGGLPDYATCLAIVALTCVAELLAFELYDRSSFSVSYALILAAGLFAGPAALLVATWFVAGIRGVLRHSRLDKILFNGAVFSLAGLGAVWVTTWGGAVPVSTAALPALAAGAVAGSLVYYLHTGVVALAMGLDLRVDPRLVWGRNFRWLFPHYIVLGLMGLGLAVATVELGLLGGALFLAPPLMMRVVLKQYTDRTIGAMARLETTNAELVTTSDLLRRRGDELALLSDLGQLAASEPRASSLPALIVERLVPALGEVCAVVWTQSGAISRAVAGPAGDVRALLESVPPDELPALTGDGDAWSVTELPGGEKSLGWLITWSATPRASDSEQLTREVARRLALVLERDALLEEAASVETLREVSRARSDFVATVAHELRTPLTSLQGFTELLRSEVEPSVRDRWLRIVQSESAQLGQLLDQLLDVARFDSQRSRAQKTAFEVSEVVMNVVASLAEQAALSGHHFECDVPVDLPHAFADPSHVERVLRNLVSNALKYAPDGGPVRVRIEAQGPADLEITVSDEGLGIPAEWQPRLFERFLRVDSPDRASIRGIGLGLYIARQLVELNGGRIWVTSGGAARGSEFHFTIPSVPPAFSNRPDGTLAV
jgi:diguanylate cyclase (GGDEF)-like protein